MESFKCYADADLTLDPGVTVIHGLNGSGKSSLLEAAFFALYGSKAIDETLGDVVTIGAEECTVELWFAHDGGEYHITRRVRTTGERASTAECILETPDGTFEGARAVRRRVTELLRMDSEAFVNCAYVRQGEVNKLINASPSERQDMLDDLLQLGKLEEYRERASDARVGVKRVREDKQSRLDQIEEQIEAKENKNLHERLNSLESDLSETVADIERIEDQRETAIETRDQAKAVLKEYEQRREELTELQDEIEKLSEQITETETERKQLTEQLTETKTKRESLASDLDDVVSNSEIETADPECVGSRLSELESRAEELRSQIETQKVEAQKYAGKADSLESEADDLEQRAEDARQSADELAETIETARESIETRQAEVSDLDEEVSELESEFESVEVDPSQAADYRDETQAELATANQRVTELETELSNARETVQEAESLLDAGNCPECGQPVEESPHVDSLEADRERVERIESELEDARETVSELETELERAESLADTADRLESRRDERETITQLLTEKQASLEDDNERLEELRENADSLEANAETKREEAETARERAGDCRSKIGEYNSEHQECKAAIERVERIEELLDTIDDIDTEIEQLRSKRDQKAELNDQRHERLAEKRDRKSELAEQVDEERIEEARNERERAESYIDDAGETLEELRTQQEEYQTAIGGVKNELEDLEQLREQHGELANAVSELDTLYEESEQLQEMYGQLRAELRQRNVETLERMLNETFDLMYQNDSYSHIELDGEYQLTVFQKDGDPLEPAQLSGGERALFNLSLRCAIYRLLAEGIEGTAPMPPLILDEPTVFLDSGHVTQLLDLVAYMRDEIGVAQILVVSHDEELVGAADDLVRVEKDATTNRSHVRRVDRLEGAVLDAVQ
jgi:exonuclease SbcC